MSGSENEWIFAYLDQADEDGYVPFNADRRLGQNQYASRHADGRIDSANLGQGLRWKGLDGGDYHSILIHRDDLLTFHARSHAYRNDVSRGEAKDISHYLAITVTAA